MVMLLFDAIFISIFLSDLPKYQIPKPREILFTSTVDFALIFVAREKIMTTPRKEIKRESRREKKAETAAELDKVKIPFFDITVSTMLWIYIVLTGAAFNRVLRKSCLKDSMEDFMVTYIIFYQTISTKFLTKMNCKLSAMMMM